MRHFLLKMYLIILISLQLELFYHGLIYRGLKKS